MSKVRTLISAYSAENFKFLWNSNLLLLHKRSWSCFFHHYCDILIEIIGWFSLIMLRPTPWRMLLEFHLIDLAFMSAEHDVSARSFSRKVPTKRHAVAYKLSRWDANDSHLISLTLLHVHSLWRALAHSINLHFPSLPPYYNIMHFVFIGILSFLLLICIHVDVNTYIYMDRCVRVHMNTTWNPHTMMSSRPL